MKLNKELVKKGMYLSGIMNIGGVLVFSRFFTNKVINEADPVVMSNFGLLMIVVWGFAFLAMASKWEHLKWIIGVFVIEKLIYGFTWTKWMINNELSCVYEADTMAGIFFTIYGLNDWFFCIFYLVVFVYLNKVERNS
ncbi:hypothetical protein [uncultured Winogradskyella sp.]|uniref:hypothetical protein n=1 Tax=uncultured Winogradskyella sp. TaxID=395353 RepID=UPI002624A587|nr:hypothetical protein [uncultured Winogradskyella sp.]